MRLIGSRRTSRRIGWGRSRCATLGARYSVVMALPEPCAQSGPAGRRASPRCVTIIYGGSRRGRNLAWRAFVAADSAVGGWRRTRWRQRVGGTGGWGADSARPRARGDSMGLEQLATDGMDNAGLVEAQRAATTVAAWLTAGVGIRVVGRQSPPRVRRPTRRLRSARRPGRWSAPNPVRGVRGSSQGGRRRPHQAVPARRG